MSESSVSVRREPVVFPTYEPQPADRNPMFLEKRVYQGSSGKVYPLPFYDRIADHKTDRAWDAVHLENEFLELLILPEIGGRIHVGRDKTNGYNFFYRQEVIKPALVGLAGPWISGGVEFNWSQHHRPATFMPVDVEIENHADGSVTVWCSDHDPMVRMKGMHGVCLHPGKAIIEVKVRAHNRTQLPQTFLWWANVATRVHERYQSFFPPDVRYVADHARRATSRFPLCTGHYYGVDYGSRARNGVPAEQEPPKFVPPGGYAPNDLSWYANIPVPTSYMCASTVEDFFGGYDHAAQAGVVHVANHHISPGKKQWTWGNHEFGYAWDRNLSDDAGPYIELMAGVYTDNQPDFSFLMPGETKTWSQFWYPIQKIGPADKANADAALCLSAENGAVRIGVCVTARHEHAIIRLSTGRKTLGEFTRDLDPGSPFAESVTLPRGIGRTGLSVRVLDGNGSEIIAFTPLELKRADAPQPATEPPPPSGIASNDELYVTGLHLEQYRHATRSPADYWREALRRDPVDSRCNNAMGLWHFRRGEFGEAEAHFRRAIERLTLRNPNPYDGEPYYNLGLTLRHLGRDYEAYAALYKATWNMAWQSAGFHALAEIDCCRRDWPAALDHLDRSLRLNTDNLRARDLRGIVLRKLGRAEEAAAHLAATRALDPLDWWCRLLLGDPVSCDTQTRLDIALDFARAGFFAEAIDSLRDARPDPGTAPLLEYYRGWLCEKSGNAKGALVHFKRAAKAAPDYCFPSRIEEIAILESAMRANPADARAPYYLGNLLYDRRRHAEAIRLWEKAAKLDPAYSVVWRNLGIGYFNVLNKPSKARAAYDKAFRANPSDTRLLYERDQLWKRLGETPARRLREFEKHPALVRRRDDLSIELCALYNQSGQCSKALEILSARKFQPWEGGEGQPLAQHVRACLGLGREALARRDFSAANAAFAKAAGSPLNLGEAKHLLANQSDIDYWLGAACAVLGDKFGAKSHWQSAAHFRGDFQQMSVRAFSEMTYYSALSLERLGRKSEARKLLRGLLDYGKSLQKSEAKIDYFATSLPTMLIFEDDIQFRQETTALFLQAQALSGLGRKGESRRLLTTVLKRDPNHPLAADLLKSN